MSSFITKGWELSDLGQKRESNEDSILVDNINGLYAVCDGMGGHNASEKSMLWHGHLAREKISNPT